MSFERCFWGDWRRSACHLAPLSNTFLFESEGAWGLPQSPENRYHFIQASGAAMQKTIIILLVLPFSAHAGDLAQNNTYTFCINQNPSAHDCFVVQSNRDCGDSSYSGDGSYAKASQSYSTSAAACAAARGSDACRDGFRC